MTNYLASPVLEQTQGAGFDNWEIVYQDCIGTGLLPVSQGSAIAAKLWEEKILSRSALLDSFRWVSMWNPAAFGRGREEDFQLSWELANIGPQLLRMSWSTVPPPLAEADAEQIDHGLTERVLAAVDEIRSVLALSTDEVCRVGGFNRRNLSNWAGEKTPHQSTVRHLLEAHTLVRAGVRAWGGEGFRSWVLERVPDEGDLVSLLSDGPALKTLVRSFTAERAEQPRLPRLSDELELESSGPVEAQRGRTHTPRAPGELRRPRRIT